MSAIQAWRVRVTERAVPSFAEGICLGVITAASAMVVALFLVQEHRMVGVLGMPLDDAWIHFRVAENLARGDGFSFNPGVPTSASTSPAWTALLAITYLATKQFVVPAIGLGILFYWAGNVAVYFLTLTLKPDRKVALVAALLAAVTGRWVWASFSGMETTLFTALILWGLLLYVRRRSGQSLAPILGAGLLALAALVRPEGFLMLGLVAAWELWAAWRGAVFSPGTLMKRAPKSGAIVPVAALLVSLAIRVAYTLGTGGGLAGNTFMAQSLPQGAGPYTGPRLAPDFWYLRSAVDTLRSDDFLLGLLIPLGMILCIRLAAREQAVRRLSALCLLWFVGLPLFNSVVAPNLRHHERYLMPLIPLAIIFGTLGISLLVEQTVGERWHLRIPKMRRSATAASLFVLVAAILLGDALFDTRLWVTQYAGDVHNIQEINVELGEWLKNNTPGNAYVAMNDIGAIAFFSERKVLDTVGIAEPGILPYIQQQGRQGVLEYLQQKKPDYVVIWPEWYPELAARSDILERVYSVKVDRSISTFKSPMLGGQEMVVYKTHWPSS